MGGGARARVLGMVSLIVLASLGALASADPVAASTTENRQFTYHGAGWILVDATIYSGGKLTVNVEGVSGKAPYLAAIHFLTPGGEPVAGGMAAYDGDTTQRTAFVDAKAAGIQGPVFPIGEPQAGSNSPAVWGAIEGTDAKPYTFRILAYVGGAGNPELDFTVTGHGVDILRTQSGGALFLTEKELALAYTHGDLPGGNAFTLSAQGAVNAAIKHRLFGYFGVVAGVNSECRGTCVSDDTTTLLTASNGARTLPGGSLTFFGELAGTWTFTNHVHVGVQQPAAQANAANCAEKQCVQFDLTRRPTLLLLVADIPY